MGGGGVNLFIVTLSVQTLTETTVNTVLTTPAPMVA